MNTEDIYIIIVNEVSSTKTVQLCLSFVTVDNDYESQGAAHDKKSISEPSDQLIHPVPPCENQDRLEHISKHCETAPPLEELEHPYRYLQAHMFVDTKHKLLACLPPKSGCTTWKSILANNSQDEPLPKNFNIMALHFQNGTEVFGINHLWMYNNSMNEYFLKNYYKIMVTRHPLERFRSTYIDKLESGSDSNYQGNLGGAIHRYLPI